jgi:SAM-dependent methyltransferase
MQPQHGTPAVAEGRASPTLVGPLVNIDDVMSLLSCPAGAGLGRLCGGALVRVPDEQLRCTSCGVVYQIDDGIAILIPPSKPEARSAEWSHQREYFDHGVDPTFELERPEAGGRFYAHVLGTKFGRALNDPRVPRTWEWGLDACCGSGLLATELARRSRQPVVGFDFSLESVRRARERARRRGYGFVGIVADAAAPPFRAGAFDVVAVHDALHHLEDPLACLERLARLSRQTLVVIEPAVSWLTWIAVRLGLSVDVEEAGNRVRRLHPGDLVQVARDAGYKDIANRRYLMYYPHVPGPVFRSFDRPPLWSLGRFLLAVGAVLGPVGGNKCQVIARR